MRKRFFWLIFLAVLISFNFILVDAKAIPLDTNNILSLKDFYTQILENHPIVRQAKLLNELAKQELRIARGGFDPKLQADYQQKQFGGTEYYSLFGSKLKVPTWLGEIQGGYDRALGTYVNPENRIFPSETAGLTSIGINLPLGKGFIIDERRNTLKQARYFQDIADADKVKTINKILLSAAKDYWEWYFAFRRYNLIDYGVKLAQDRLNAVKVRVKMGELAAIDSIQALIIYQERQIDLRQAEVELINTKIIVSNYMWGTNETPLELADGVNPENFGYIQRFVDQKGLEEMLEFAKENHPEIRKLVFKLKQLEVEERFQTNSLLPTLDVNYNLLQSFQPKSDTYRFNLNNNYKLGINFEFPLFLRKERGKLAQVRIKQNQNNFELIQIRREIQNNVLTAYNELKNLEQLIRLTEIMVENYRILLDGERQRFSVGESNLFILNSQESKLIESQIKLESQKTKYEKARATLIWASGGQLWN